MEEQTAAQAIARLARSVTAGDLDRTLEQITAAAVRLLPGVDYASITVRYDDGRTLRTARTDPLLDPLEEVEVRSQQGPSHVAVAGAEQLVSFDLASDARFPAYSDAARGIGIHAQASVRIFEAATATGTVMLYSRTRGAFADISEAGALFAARSTRTLERAQELAVLADAVVENRLVGRAVGIAMERYALTEPRAFALLVRLGTQHDAELAQVAEALVHASDERAD